MSDKNHPSLESSLNPPPGSWQPARRLFKATRGSVEHFLHTEASSGILLLLVAFIALLWINSPWASSYQGLWHTPLALKLGRWSFERDLHFWINDGLMTIFFFVVGLEIKRELHRGELSELKRAALPLFAAVGGMVLPALIYAGINQGKASAVGWGVPMATDIAFAVGVMALLGRRVSPALRILLLTLAVIDDIGAILVIGIFYSSDIALSGFAVAGAGLGLIYALQKLGVRSPIAYLLPSLIAWAGTYAGGVHPTIAGVLIGLMTPVQAWVAKDTFETVTADALQKIKGSEERPSAQAEALHEIAVVQKELNSPVDRLIPAFHGWVAFLIMPLFALANAGVPLGGLHGGGDSLFVLAGVIAGLVIGKPLGIFLISWAAIRLGWAAMPQGVNYKGLTVVGLCAGIGFTMAFFVAQLAFAPGENLESAKLAILVASAISAFGAFVYGRLVLRPVTVGARTESEAESSTHL